MRTGLHRIAATLMVTLVLSTGAMAAQDAAAPDTAAKQREFDAGIERLKQGDATVDVRRLRQLSTELPSYDPYARGRNVKEMLAATRRDDSKEALRLARIDLAADYLDIDAQMVAMIASKMEGDTKGFDHHRFVVLGILDSIIKFGDGKTPATAYVVVTVREEYAVLKALGLGMKKQGLDEVDSHSFDVMTVVDTETNAESVVYFNIDVLMAHQMKKFEPEKPMTAPAGGIVGGVPSGVPGIGSGDAPRKVSGGVLSGRAKLRPQPPYPKMASAAGVEGAVVVEVVVNEEGLVISSRALSGHPLLRDAAVEAARAWVFEPTVLEGAAVKIVGTITFNFRKS